MKYAKLNPIAAVGLKKLPETYTETENVEEADAILVRSFQMLEMEFSENLKCVARAGAGVNNIPLDRLAEKGVVVFNTPGANANGVKELTVAALLLAARDIKGGMQWVADNAADENIGKTMEKAKAKYGGTEILGKTLGIVGLGAIGALVANAVVALGMNVVGYDPYLSDKVRAMLNENVKIVDNTDELYAVSDYVTIHVPELPSTKGTFCKATFEKMKDGAVVLNLARPGLVNEADLKEALESGKIRKYVTDVPSFATANMPNVIAFPHLGASTEEAEDNCAMMAAAELTDYLENGNIVNSVNFPAVNMGPKTGTRVGIAFKEGADTEAMKALVKGFTKFEAKAGKGFGYALFEAPEVTAETVAALQNVANVLKVRAM